MSCRFFFVCFSEKAAKDSIQTVQYAKEQCPLVGVEQSGKLNQVIHSQATK